MSTSAVTRDSIGPETALSQRHPTLAVVPVAGHGTRLRPLSAYIPKELLPVGSRLALWRIAEELAFAGITRILFIVSPEKQAFVEKCFAGPSQGHERSDHPAFAEGPIGRVQFDCIVQPTMRGLGDAILCAREYVGDQPFVVALGDAVYEETEPGALIRRLIDAFVAEDAALALSVQAVAQERISRYGVVRPVRGFSVTDATIASVPADPNYLVIDDIVEKPAPENAPSNLAAAARYIVVPEVFALLEQTPPDARGEVQFTSALQELLRTGKNGVAIPLQHGEVRHDIGSLESYFRAFVTFAAKDPEWGADFHAFLRRFVQESAASADENGR